MEAAGTAVVTGAGRGIGRGIALELCARGFDVVATMRDPAAGIALAAETVVDGAGSLAVQALDLTDPGTFDLPDGLTVLVNNAGVDDRNIPLEDLPGDAWRRVFETNVFGTVELMRQAIPRMREAGGGVICNITSAGLLVPMPFFSLYRASKAAISAVGESLRAELAPHNIRILEILPGPVATDMLAESAIDPVAMDSPAYAELAAVVAAARGGMDDLAVPVTVAASAIVDAILDDARGLRSGCDPIGDALLAAWQRMGDEENQAPYLAAFRVPD